jgi:hypothetical protein
MFRTLFPKKGQDLRQRALSPVPRLVANKADYLHAGRAFAPGKSRFGMVIGSALVCLFWNGIVSVFLVQIIGGFFRTGSWHGGQMAFSTFGAFFMIPFVLVGLGLLWWFVHSLLALFNPSVRITFPVYPLALGGTFDLEWNIAGNAARINRLTFLLEGRESATYARGTDTVTEKQVFKTISIYEADKGTLSVSGNTTLSIPAGTMHSFNSKHNKIIWVLKIKGDIPRWPDIGDEYQIEVMPGNES